MAALAELPQTTRRLLLASDCEDQSEELARILQNAGSVEAISIYDLPDHPASDFAGVIIDIDLCLCRRRLQSLITHRPPPSHH